MDVLNKTVDPNTTDEVVPGIVGEIPRSGLIRNVSIGGVGLLLNAIAIVAVVKKDKVQKGRKLLLLNMILSDGSSLLALACYGIDYSTTISEGAGCVPFIFTVMLSFSMSHTTCLVIAVLNFIALYRPMTYRNHVTWRVICSIIAASWLVWGGITLWAVGSDHAPGKRCAPIEIIESKRYLTLAIVWLGFAFGIGALNSAIVFKLRNQHTAVAARLKLSKTHRVNLCNVGVPTHCRWRKTRKIAHQQALSAKELIGVHKIHQNRSHALQTRPSQHSGHSLPSRDQIFDLSSATSDNFHQQDVQLQSQYQRRATPMGYSGLSQPTIVEDSRNETETSDDNERERERFSPRPLTLVHHQHNQFVRALQDPQHRQAYKSRHIYLHSHNDDQQTQRRPGQQIRSYYNHQRHQTSKIGLDGDGVTDSRIPLEQAGNRHNYDANSCSNGSGSPTVVYFTNTNDFQLHFDYKTDSSTLADVHPPKAPVPSPAYADLHDNTSGVGSISSGHCTGLDGDPYSVSLHPSKSSVIMNKDRLTREDIPENLELGFRLVEKREKDRNKNREIRLTKIDRKLDARQNRNRRGLTKEDSRELNDNKTNFSDAAASKRKKKIMETTFGEEVTDANMTSGDTKSCRNDRGYKNSVRETNSKVDNIVISDPSSVADPKDRLEPPSPRTHSDNHPVPTITSAVNISFESQRFEWKPRVTSGEAMPQAGVTVCPDVDSTNRTDELLSLPPGRTKHHPRICKTLTLQTTYSALVTVAICVYVICFFLGRLDAQGTLRNPVVVIITLLPVTKSCVNPVLYVWTFVNWRDLVAGRCKRSCSNARVEGINRTA